MRFRLVRQHEDVFQVRNMCRALSVSQSGYYAWRDRPESARGREDRQLERVIRIVHEKSRQTYGSPRVHAEMKAQGHRVGRKRVERLMRKAKLQSKRRRRFRGTTRSNPAHPVAPNVLARRFESQDANRIWLGDVTYIWTREGWLYLAVLMDLFSRRIVGWAVRDRLEQGLTQAALERALFERQPQEGLLHHSDRGSQYTAGDYRDILKEAGLEVSMSGKGNCWDNSPIESFFATLKCERVSHVEYETRDQARCDLFDFIEIFYNRQRRHSALGYLSPAEYERRAEAPAEILVSQKDRPATRFRRTTRFGDPEISVGSSG